MGKMGNESGMDPDKTEVIRLIEEQADCFTGISDRVWETPELSLQEYEAAALYAKALRENGFQTEEGFGGIRTALKGTYGSGRPVIGFLGEYDALSGMSQKAGVPERESVRPGGPGHGCGHNLLGAGAFAAAVAVRHYLERTGTPGTVVWYGCPGEEGGAAKAFFARDGLFRELDAALTWHPADANEVVTGTNNSCIQVQYRFHGIAAHAAGDPWNGRSALDGVELMNTGVQYLREHMPGDCRVHYAITDAGGISPNVVQADAAVLYMVRAVRVKDSLALLKRVDEIAQGAALMTQTRVTRQFIDGTAQLIPNYCLEDVLRRNFEQISLPVYTPEELALAARLKRQCPSGEIPGIAAALDDRLREQVSQMSGGGQKPLNDFLMPPLHAEGYVPGSTDVGDVSQQTPTAQIHTAAFVSCAPGHSWQNVSCGGSSIGHKALLLAGKVLACSAIDLYRDPEILREARREWERRMEKEGGYQCPIEPGAVPTIP